MKYHTITGAAQEIGCSETTLREMIKRGEIPVCKRGDKSYISNDDIDMWSEGIFNFGSVDAHIKALQYASQDGHLTDAQLDKIRGI